MLPSSACTSSAARAALPWGLSFAAIWAVYMLWLVNSRASAEAPAPSVPLPLPHFQSARATWPSLVHMIMVPGHAIQWCTERSLPLLDPSCWFLRYDYQKNQVPACAFNDAWRCPNGSVLIHRFGLQMWPTCAPLCSCWQPTVRRSSLCRAVRRTRDCLE